MSGHRAEPALHDARATTLEPARVAGRRVAPVPVDSRPLETAFAPYVGRRRAAAPAVPLDTGTIERVLSDLVPTDHTTSFEYEDTARLPLLRASAPVPAAGGSGGRRRAVRHSGRRGPLFKGLPSAPVLLGVAALAVSVGGAVSVGEPEVITSRDVSAAHAATALNGSSATVKITGRSRVVSRDDARDAQEDAAGQELKAAAEGLAKQRNSALTDLASKAEARAAVIAEDLWQYPLEPVALTARFGQYGLWSSYHTGLDFNGNDGDQIHSISNGVVTSASYDGSYGNKTVVELEDGTEIWYCHQSAFNVSVGDTVRAGEIIGLVGSTGHVTGSHLHLEVRPGGGDPVDPYTAMQQHGLF